MLTEFRDKSNLVRAPLRANASRIGRAPFSPRKLLIFFRRDKVVVTRVSTLRHCSTKARRFQRRDSVNVFFRLCTVTDQDGESLHVVVFLAFCHEKLKLHTTQRLGKPPRRVPHNTVLIHDARLCVNEQIFCQHHLIATARAAAWRKITPNLETNGSPSLD